MVSESKKVILSEVLEPVPLAASARASLRALFSTTGVSTVGGNTPDNCCKGNSIIAVGRRQYSKS